MLPDITLTADAGLQNPALNAAVLTLSGTGFALSLGASLVHTIFDGGLLKAKTAETEAREEELLAAYRAAALAAFAITWLAKRQIGGYTGDVLGAAQQAAEIAVLLALCAR